MGSMNSIRPLVDLRHTMQKNRIAFGNRLDAIIRGADDGNEDSVRIWHERFLELENLAEKEVLDVVDGIPIIEDMVQVRGVGPLTAAKIICMIDIDKAPTPAALWRYSGYGVTNGKRDRPTKGQKLVYNVRLKTTLYQLAESFLRSSSPYRDVYDDAKAYYQVNRPDWTKNHIHLASMRKMVKVYLVHLYEHWRALEGKPIREPYVIEKLGHTTKLKKEDFGWPPV